MAIQEKTITELTPQLRKLHDRAVEAGKQKNYVWACDMFRMLLKAEPGLVEPRRTLRQLQLDRIGNKISLGRQAMAFFKVGWPILVKGPVLLQRGKIPEALDLAEKAMDIDPSFLATLMFLAKAAEAAELHNAGVQALEIAANFYPKDLGVLVRLADYYKTTKAFQKGLRVCQQLEKLQPNNMRFQDEVRSLSALAAMEQGNWETEGSAFSKQKDVEKSKKLERDEQKTVRDVDQLQAKIGDAEKAVGEQSTTANHKRLAELYRQSKEYDKSLEQYELMVKKMGALDPSIDAAMTEIYALRFDDAAAQWRTYGEQNPDKAQEAENNIAAIEQQKTDVIFNRLQERVKRYPNDAAYRYELGELFWAKADIDGALKEFQFAQKSPQYRRKALAFMGRCMVERNLLELAIENFMAALDGLDKVAPERKEILYYLAEAYAKSGLGDKALLTYKDIFSVDVNYRDVSQRIQDHYKKDVPDRTT